MWSFRFVKLGILINFLQTFAPGSLEEPTCLPGFNSDLFIFKVERIELPRGRVLGKVGFDDCSGRTRFLFDTDDKRFRVEPDGTLRLKRVMTLHSGHKDFSVHVWDSQGRRMTVLVRVQVHNGLHGQHHGHQGLQPSEVDSVTHTQSPESPAVPVLVFPKASAGLKRRKRVLCTPPINFPENDRGPYPKNLARIRSTYDEGEVKMHYSIVGPGADQPPEGLFIIDRYSGVLYVTQPLDREKQDKYKVTVTYTVVEGEGISQDPMDIYINVIDMNDNKPAFIMDPFLGSVPEASPIGFEIMKVVATDADEPGSANSDVRYEILSQEPQLPSPNMFSINPVSGGIRVNVAKLDRENFPKYTLEVQAADLEGKGLKTQGKVIITVTDSSDNAPELVQESIRSSNDKEVTIHYSIVGPGADQPPEGLFIIDRNSGVLYVTQPLDREKQDKYKIKVHATDVLLGPAEKPIDIIIKVRQKKIDRSDNKPIFTSDPLIGTVPEASAIELS